MRVPLFKHLILLKYFNVNVNPSYMIGYLPDSPHTPALDAFLLTPKAHFKKWVCIRSHSDRLIFLSRLLLLSMCSCLDCLVMLRKIGIPGAQIGAPYNAIGLMRLSNNMGMTQLCDFRVLRESSADFPAKTSWVQLGTHPLQNYTTHPNFTSR